MDICRWILLKGFDIFPATVVVVVVSPINIFGVAQSGGDAAAGAGASAALEYSGAMQINI